MALHFSGHLSSETIEIIAQSGEKRFFVHRDIIAAQSKPLRQTVQDGSADRSKIDLQEWDGDTVGRFVEFLYIGHYQVPNPTERPESAVSEVGTDQCGADTPATSRSGTVRSDSTEIARSEDTTTTSPVGPRPLTPLWQFSMELQNRAGPYMDREALEVFGLGSFDPAVCDYGEVLLAHAKVYSLAQNQEVKALRKLSYKRLLSTLLRIGSVEPGWQVTIDFIALLRYVYSHTVISPGDSEEPLQKIVSQFAALNFPALQSRDEMTELIREGGKLASDLMNKVYKRLAHSESCLQEVPALRAELQRLDEAVKGYAERSDSRLQAEKQKVDIPARERCLEPVTENELSTIDVLAVAGLIGLVICITIFLNYMYIFLSV